MHMVKKNLIIFISLILIFLIIGYLTCDYILNYKNSSEEFKNNNDEHSNGDNNIILYDEYLYILPEGFFYNILTDSNNSDKSILHIHDNINKWGANIELIDKSIYDNGIFSDYDKLEVLLKNKGNNITNRNIANRYNIESISFELNGSESSCLLAFMPAYDNKEYQIMLYDGDDKSMNYDALDTTLNILLTGKKCEY